MCVRETSLTAQRPNLSISSLPSLLPCLTGFPSVSQWEQLLQQNKQKNTEIYIKTTLDVSRCRRAVSQGMVFSCRRNHSCNYQPFHNRLLEVFYFLHLQFVQLRDLHERAELNTELHVKVCCMIWKIKGYLWSATILHMAKGWQPFPQPKCHLWEGHLSGLPLQCLALHPIFTSNTFRTTNINGTLSILGSTMLIQSSH